MGIDYTKRPSTPPPPPPPPPGTPPPPPGGVSLSKVTLTKAAPSVSLTKHGGTGGMMRVNLNWNALPQGGGGFFRKAHQLDLDLGCLYEFSDGSKGVVQALGNSFRAGPRSGPPDLIWLDGDDRSGQASGGENLFINLDYISAIRRVLVFALIYEGAANWAAAQGVTTMFPVNAAPIEIRLDNPQDGARICAIAQLINNNGELIVQHEVNYINGAQRALDQAYGWGMNWTAGRK